MEIFDCNVFLGRPYAPSVPINAYAEKPDALLKQMAFWGINRALVRHISMEEESPVIVNRMVIEETYSSDILEPSWAILPPQTGELGTLDEFQTQMKEKGIRALWAFPLKQSYLLTGTTFGKLFEIMIQRCIPLFLSIKEFSNSIEAYSIINALLHDFPNLIIVATNHGCRGEDRLFRPLIEKYKNFYIDTSHYELPGGISDFCNRYGPYRLIFGTGFPEVPMGGALLTLKHADIPDNAKEAIFGRNLKCLLTDVRL